MNKKPPTTTFRNVEARFCDYRRIALLMLDYQRKRIGLRQWLHIF